MAFTELFKKHKTPERKKNPLTPQAKITRGVNLLKEVLDKNPTASQIKVSPELYSRYLCYDIDLLVVHGLYFRSIPVVIVDGLQTHYEVVYK